jgi:FAD/FMN-containing dehydrogenase
MKRRTFCSSAVALATAATPLGRLLAQTVEPGTAPAMNIAAVTRLGAEIELPKSAIKDLAGTLRGQVILTGERGYEQLRRIWNGMIDRKPALIVRCLGASDVMKAVNFAREHDLLIAVRGGGHSMSGQSVCDGGMMIHLGPIRGVRVDPTARTARVGAGALLGDLDREAQSFGLVTTAGTVSHTGVAGLTLGGGFGRLARKFGLTCDNLRSADVITAKGEYLRASARENTDLFWGLRGGGGNFGIVTSFEYQLHEMSATVLGGPIMYPFESAREVLTFFADFAQRMPDELSATAALVAPPGGKPMMIVETCYAGRIEDGERAVAELRRFGKPLADHIQPMPYIKLQTTADGANAPGRFYYAKSGFIAKVDASLIERIVEGFRPDPARATVTVVQRLGGAISQVRQRDAAFPHRDAHYDLMALSGWTRAEDSERHIGWLRGYWATLAPATDGFYVNTTTVDDDEQRIRANYRENYDRLVKLKNRYDPANLFRLNANVMPTV